MANVFTHFTNSIKGCTDRENNRLKPKAFIHPDKSEISVVCIDEELSQPNSDSLIFAIGDLIYKKEPKVKARGDMLGAEIENITYGEDNLKTIHLEYDPTEEILNHYLIKPDLYDLEFANLCAYKLSRISKLVIK